MGAAMVLSSDIDEIVNGLGQEFWAMFAGKRVLLTGARGFLGRYFTEVFVRANELYLQFVSTGSVEIVALDNLIASGAYGNEKVERPNVAFVQHDVIQPFVPERPVDFILHAAGIASPAKYQQFPVETYSVSVFGTRNMLDIAKKNPGCRLVFFSSSEIYGDPESKNVPTDESYPGRVPPLGARACYDEGKRFGEMMVGIDHKKFGVPGVIVRPFNVFGPSMQRTDERVLPNFAARWVDGQPLHVYGTGRQTRTFCYVTDAVVGFLLVVLKGVPGEAYNIGTPAPEISMLDLVRRIEKALAELSGEAPPRLEPKSEPKSEPVKPTVTARK